MFDCLGTIWSNIASFIRLLQWSGSTLAFQLSCLGIIRNCGKMRAKITSKATRIMQQYIIRIKNVLNTIKPHISVEKVKNKISCLRTSFSREYRAIETLRCSGWYSRMFSVVLQRSLLYKRSQIEISQTETSEVRICEGYKLGNAFSKLIKAYFICAENNLIRNILNIYQHKYLTLFLLACPYGTA